MSTVLDALSQQLVARTVRELTHDDGVRERIARGHVATAAELEQQVQARLAHLPPAAVQLAVADELARAQLQRRSAWLRFAAQRGARLPWEQLAPAHAPTADEAAATPHADDEDDARAQLGASSARVVVAVDGSAPSLRAVENAARIARAWQLTLDLVSVMDAGDNAGDARHALLLQARDDVLRAARAHAADVAVVDVRVVYGHVVTALLQEASSAGVQLVALGRRGKSDPHAQRPGSVSQLLCAHAPVPVLVVP